MDRRRRNIRIVAGVGAFFIISVLLCGATYRDQAPLLTLILYAGLIVMTMIYAYFTMEIADATRRQAEITGQQAEAARQQANASVKMAEAIAKPGVFPDFTDVIFPKPSMIEIERTRSNKIGVIRFLNLGTGAALNGEIKFSCSAPDVVKKAWKEGTGQYGSMAGVQEATWAILEPGKGHLCQPELAECNPGNIGTAFTIYSDIYGRRFLSGWGYRCEKDNRDNIILQRTEMIHPLPEREV